MNLKSLILFCLYVVAAFADPIDANQVKMSLDAHIHPNLDGLNRVGKITIDDRSSGISQSTWIYVKNALDYYKKNPPLFLILELNTPGGEVFSAQKISDALKDLDTQYDIPVVAYINNWAISAGAMLAYSSRYIAVVKDGSMGAAEPVLQDEFGEMKSASEKINSALRTDFANRAQFFDRNPNIAEAMVDKDILLVFRDGNIIKAESEKPGDLIISPKGKLLTLNAKQLMDYKVADIALKPTKRSPITYAEKEKGEWPASKEDLFQYPTLASIPNVVIDEYQMDWKTLFFVLLASPLVTSALMLGMMLGFYIEFNHPGLSLPGILAAFCLFLLALSSFSLQIADSLELILLCSGLVLLVLDLFFLPTFGIIGSIGILLFLIGFLGMLLPGIGLINFDFDSKTFNAAGEAFFNRLGLLLITALGGIACILMLARFIMPSFKGFKKFVLEGNEQEGFTSGILTKDLPVIGASGIVVAVLRPAGKVEIQGKLYDAISLRRLIAPGIEVKVVGYESSQLIVEEKK